MWLILGCAILTIFVVGGIVWFHAKKPDDKFLQAAKEWQTLIGALLGFFFLSSSVLVSETYQSEVEAHRSAAQQQSYAKILSNELNLYHQDLIARSGLFEPSERSFDGSTCVQALSLLRQMPLASFSIERNHSELVPSFSDEFNFIASSAIEARHRYLTEMSSIDVRDCMNDPMTYRDGLQAYHANAIRSADSMQKSLLEAVFKK